MNKIDRNQSLNSLSRDEIVKDFLNSYFKQLKENAALARKLVSNTEYIQWLEEFTFSHPSFCDTEWNYFPEQLEPENFPKVKLLHQFFEGVERYSGGKCQQEDEFGYSILIMFNHVGYRIGVQHGQGCYHFCERVEIFQNESSFIDFNNIMKEAN